MGNRAQGRDYGSSPLSLGPTGPWAPPSSSLALKGYNAWFTHSTQLSSFLLKKPKEVLRAEWPLKSVSAKSQSFLKASLGAEGRLNLLPGAAVGSS